MAGTNPPRRDAWVPPERSDDPPHWESAWTREHRPVDGGTDGAAGVLVRLFGTVTVDLDGHPTALGGAKPRGLLAMLALGQGRDVHADRLVAGIWDEDSDGDPARALRVVVSRLRSSLDRAGLVGREIVKGRYPLYRLAAGVPTDASRARELRAEASALAHSDPDAGLVRLADAAALVDADPLGDLLHLPFATTAAPALVELRLTTEDSLTAALLARNGLEPTLPRLWDQARSAPERDERWRRLAESLVALGRTTEALLALDEGEAAVAASGLAPGLSARLQALRRTLRTGAPIGGPAPPGDVPPTLASREPDVWAGRRRELADLVDACHAYLADRRVRVVEVVGSGGVGKTSLAAVFARSAAGMGCRVVYVRWHRSTGGSLHPLVEAGLLPPSDDGTATADRPGRSIDVAERVHEVIGRLTALDPLVLVVDDVHWATGSARDALAELLDDEQLDALVLVLRRPDPRPGLGEGPSPALRLELRPLDDDEREEMSIRLERLGHRVAGSRPRVAPWLADALARGVGSERVSEWWDEAEPDELWLLILLAVSSEWVGPALLAAALDEDEGATTRTTRLLVADGVVEEGAGPSPRFRPVHDVVVEAVLERAGPSRVAEAHARLHEASARLGTAAISRVEHALGAATLIGTDDLVATVEAAVDELLAAGLHHDVVDLVDATAARTRGTLPPRLRIARTFAAAGLGQGIDPAGELFDAATAAAGAAEWDAVVAALSFRNLLGHEPGETAGEVAIISQARAATDPTRLALAFDLAHLDFMARLHGGAAATELGALLADAERIADELGAPGRRGRASHLRHQVQSMDGTAPADFRATSLRTLRLAREAGDRGLEATAQADLLYDSLSLHDLGGFAGCIDALLALDDPHGRWYGRQCRAALLLDQGDLAGAGAAIEEARRVGERYGIPSGPLGYMALRFALAWVGGGLSDLVGFLSSVDWRAPSQAILGAAHAAAVFQSGDTEGAGVLAAEMVEHLDTYAVEGWQEAATWALLAEAGRGAPEVAVASGQHLDRWAGGRVFLAADFGPVDRYRALCALATGDEAGATRLLASAASQAGCPLWTGRVAIDRAAQGLGPTPILDGDAWSWMSD